MLFNKFMLQRPNPNEAAWDILFKTYLEQSNSIDIFPKIQSMCKTCNNLWKQNNLIKLTNKEMSDEYFALFCRFANARENSRNEETIYNNEVDNNIQIEEPNKQLTAPPINMPTQEAYLPALPAKKEKNAFGCLIVSIMQVSETATKRICVFTGENTSTLT